MRLRSVASLVALVLALGAVGSLPAVAVAQSDSLRLGALHAEALRLDPRQQQLRLQQTAAELRLRSIGAERLPALSVNGQAQYQSAVTKIAAPIPGIAFPTPPHDTYDARVSAEQALFDPAIAPRRATERARLAESQAQVRTTLFSLRQEIDEAFFTAVALQQRIAVIDGTISDLAAHLREVGVRFREGAATPGDTATVAATMLQRRQDRLQLDADRVAALSRLSALIGRPVDARQTLALPDLATPADVAARSLDTLRARPEYEQFKATRERLASQEAVVTAQDRPRISAFGRVGYGRPGLDLLSTSFQPYWLTGVQLRWTPWRWGTTDRDRELLEIEREIATTNETAFARGLQRAVQPSLAVISRRDSTLALDDRIIALRESVVREAASQLREGVITAATYVDRSTELLTARLQRIQHRVELEQARATFLNTLGVEVP